MKAEKKYSPPFNFAEMLSRNCRGMFLLFKLLSIQTESSTEVALIQPEAEVQNCGAAFCVTEITKSSGFKDLVKILTHKC